MRLQRYIFGLLLKNFALVLVVITTIVFLAVLVQSMGRIQQGSLGLLLSRIPYLVPSALSLGIPLSILVGVLLTYGRLSADNEILAIRMGGIHPFHAISPAIVLGLVLSAVAIYINGTLGPLGQVRAHRVTEDDLRKFLDSLEARRVHSFRSDRLQMSWQAADEDGSLVEVRFSISPADGIRLEGAAGRARIAKDDRSGELRFAFDEVTYWVGEMRDEHRADREVFKYPVVSLFGPQTDLRRRNLLTSEELLYRALRAPRIGHRGDTTSLTLHKVEYYDRIGMALSCFVFVLVGAPVGILFRRGSFVASSVVALVTAFVVYYPLHEVGKSLAEFRSVPPVLAMSIPGVVLLVAGLALLAKVLSR